MRGVAQGLIDHPIEGKCWCGKAFTKKAENQEHCSAYHRNLASILRTHLPSIPPPVPQVKRVRATPAAPATTDLDPTPTPTPTPSPTPSPAPGV